MAKRSLISWTTLGEERVLGHAEALDVDASTWSKVPLVNMTPDSELLRFWTLFWDEILLPHWDDALLVSSSTEGRLLDAGILSFYPVDRFSLDEFLSDKPHTPDGRTAFILQCIHGELEKEEPGQWSIELKPGFFLREPPSATRNRDLLVKLYDSIPVPSKNVSWKRVLKFREQRRDELLALRNHLEDIYQRIIMAGDGPLAFNTEKERLERAIRDYLAAMKEEGFRIKMADIEARIKWEFTPSVPLIAGTVGYLLGGPAVAAIGSVAAALVPKIEVSTAASIGSSRTATSPFAYIGSIHRKL